MDIQTKIDKFLADEDISVDTFQKIREIAERCIAAESKLEATEYKIGEYKEANGTIQRALMCLKDERDQLRQRIEAADKQEVFAVIAMDIGASEPRLMSWNDMPQGQHRVYALPPTADKKE